MFPRRAASYDPQEDLEEIMLKLMSMDEKLNGILAQLTDEEDDEAEPD